MAAETTATVEEIAVDTEDTAVVTEETTQELVPMMAAGCAVYGGVEAGHNNCHNYPHLHYWANGTRHNTIRLG